MSRTERIARRSNELANTRPRAVRAWSRLHARLLRATRGRFMPRWFGAPVLVLETVGRRSGRRRATPVLYMETGGAFVVLAANAGAHRTPAWWLNLRDAGEADVLVAGERTRVVPRVLEGPERERELEAFCRMYPQAREYPSFTDRPIPLVALEPR